MKNDINEMIEESIEQNKNVLGICFEFLVACFYIFPAVPSSWTNPLSL